MAWDPPANAAPGTVVSYFVSLKKSSAAGWGASSHAPQAGTVNWVQQSLEAGISYDFRVRACSGDVDSDEACGPYALLTFRTIGAPPAPTGVNAQTGSEPGTLEVTWDRVFGADGYRVQWKSGSQSFDASRQAEVAGERNTSYTIPGLTAGTQYTVRVNARAEGRYSTPSTEATGVPTGPNAPPGFTSPATFSVPENRASVGTVAATDGDADDTVTGYEVTGGADAELFSIDRDAGALTFKAAPNFELPGDADDDNAYRITVTVTSGTGPRERTATQDITVTVTDADERPGRPAAPTFGEVTTETVSLVVNWVAPANTGPAITDYDVQYRPESSQGAFTDAGYDGVATTHTITTGLTRDQRYEVQVRARSDEGLGDWSPSGVGARPPSSCPTTRASRRSPSRRAG